MIDMTTVIAKMFMLFAIMITGFITSRLGVIDETANKKFSTLVVNITAPALILASASDDKLSGSRTDALFVLLIACCMYLFLYIVSFSVKYIFRLKQFLETTHSWEYLLSMQYLTMFFMQHYLIFQIICSYILLAVICYHQMVKKSQNLH